MSKIKFFICLLAFLIILSFPVSFASSTINLGINDSIVAPPKNIAPVFVNNVCYVPVDVFWENFIISYSYDEISKTVTLIRGNTSLAFNMRQSIAIDSDKNVYFYTCYFENNTFMVPARLVCDVFGLKYSYLTTINTVRIRLTAANLSDNQFIEQYKNILIPPINEAQNEQGAGNPSNNENNTPNTNVEYKNICFMFANQPNQYTSNVLSALGSNIKATFFASKESITASPSALFEIFASGHSFGIDMTSFDNISGVSAQTLASYAEDTNTLFMKVLKTKYTALLFTKQQYSQLSDEQKSALTSLGYVLWYPTISTQDKNETPDTSQIVSDTTSQTGRQSSGIRLLVWDAQNSYNALSSIISYCNNNNPKYYTITPTKKP